MSLNKLNVNINNQHHTIRIKYPKSTACHYSCPSNNSRENENIYLNGKMFKIFFIDSGSKTKGIIKPAAKALIVSTVFASPTPAPVQLVKSPILESK